MLNRLAFFAPLALAACNQAPTSPLPGDTAAPAQALPPSAAPTTPVFSSPAAAAPAPVARVPSTSHNPQEVLIAWAKAVSTRDWATARGYWGESGARSGLSPEAFAAKWGALKDPQLDIGKGAQQGAAGSSYYTAPVTIRDGARSITGEVVMRRVNDIDGATPEQLRWHIESTTLKV